MKQKILLVLIAVIEFLSYQKTTFGYPGTAALISYRRTDAGATYLYQARCSLGTPDGRCSLTTIKIYSDTSNSKCSVGIETEFTDLRAEGSANEWLVKVVKGTILQTYFFGKSGLTITEAPVSNPSTVKSKLEAAFVEGDGNFLDVPHGNCKKMSYFVRYL
jgi:hypothetical protein